MQRVSRLKITILLTAAPLLTGCGAEEPVRPLNSAAFYRRPSIDPGAAARQPVGPVDEGGRVDPIAQEGAPNASINGISPVVSEDVKPPRAERPLVWAPASTALTTTPAQGSSFTGTPATLPTGQYMVVGTVVAEVDGAPIFANQVLEIIDKPLSLRARELDERGFRNYAQEEIKQRVRLLVRNELEYKAAERSLNEEDRRLVGALTTKWRQEEIIRAGGSIELVNRRYRAEGFDFDKAVDDQHRIYMTQVYYQKKVIPLIVITASMMRDYYDRHQATMFAEKTGSQFRYIRIDTKELGDRDKARERAEEVRAKAVADPESFPKLAKDYNKDPLLFKTAGQPIEGMIDRGAFGIKPVEEAAWALEPGQISDVVVVGDSFFVVKLEKKIVGRVKPFADEQVQDMIRGKMHSEQFRALREKEQEKLEKNAAIRQDARSMALTLDMAMQRYRQWSSQNRSGGAQ